MTDINHMTENKKKMLIYKKETEIERQKLQIREMQGRIFDMENEKEVCLDNIKRANEEIIKKEIELKELNEIK